MDRPSVDFLRDDAEPAARRPTAATDQGASRQSRLGHVLLAFVLFAIAVGMLAMTRDFGYEARRLPVVVGVPLVGLSAINLVIEAHRAWRAQRGLGGPDTRVPPTAHPQAPVAAREVATEGEGAGAISMWGALLGVFAPLVVLYLLLGQMLATPVFLLASMRFVGKQPWRNVAIVTVFVIAVTYALSEWMGVRMYDGWLAPKLPWLGWL